MDLSIIIVNWNSKEYLKNCIESILTAIEGIKYEIIVIDSASFDGSNKMLKENFPHVRFLQSRENLGFAKANNLAFKMAKGHCILFLNPDTEVGNGAIQSLYNEIIKLRDCGITGPKILNGDRTIQTTCIRKFPSIINQVFEIEILRKTFPKLSFWGIKPLFESSKDPIEVDAVSGACLMIKKSVFCDVSMFSSEYFMYSEDIDLCFKVNRSGYKVYYIPSATVVHYGGGSSEKRKTDCFADVMVLESRLRFFKKTRPEWYALSYRALMFLACAIRVMLILLLWPIYRYRGHANSFGNAIKKWTARLKWTIRRKKWVKSVYD